MNAYEKPLSYEELARHTGFSVPVIRKYKRDKGLPYYKIGNTVRFKLSEFDAWLKAHRNVG